jgi:hypothetical protein
MYNRALFALQEYRDEDYLAFIRLWPCLVCWGDAQEILRRNPRYSYHQVKPTEAAHTGEHGLSIKAPDFQTVPLCEIHHRGIKGLDRLGPHRFEQKYNIDLKREILWLIHAYLSQGNHLGKI